MLRRIELGLTNADNNTFYGPAAGDVEDGVDM